jgi:hypothetical protein
MTKYPKTQMDNLTIKVCCVKAIWNKYDKIFMNHEILKQFHANHYGNDIKIY